MKDDENKDAPKIISDLRSIGQGMLSRAGNASAVQLPEPRSRLEDATSDAPEKLPDSSRAASSKRDIVFQKTDYRCFYCTKDAETIDHMIPTSRGGSNLLPNLVGACWDCNHDKADMTMDEFIAFKCSELAALMKGEAFRRRKEKARLNKAIKPPPPASKPKAPHYRKPNRESNPFADLPPAELRKICLGKSFPPSDLITNQDVTIPNWMR